MDYRAMGARVRQRRQELKLTQEQLAERAEVSPAFIGHIERGEKKASVETVVALCGSLDISADFLIRGKRNRCDEQRCALYEDLRTMVGRYGK